MTKTKSFFVVGILILCFLPSLFDCETINCIGTEACRNSQTLTCDEDNPCVINCLGDGSCRQSKITCKDDQPCYINSNDRNVLRTAEINCPANADCIFNGTQDSAGYRNAKINCGINGSCYFLFKHYVTDILNFHFFELFNATYSRYVKIYKYGNRGSADLTSNIYCPISNDIDGGGSNCDIICGGTNGACNDMNVFAVQGFNDANITETFDNQFTDSNVYCTSDYSTFCTIGTGDPIKCADTNHICNDYTLTS